MVDFLQVAHKLVWYLSCFMYISFWNRIFPKSMLFFYKNTQQLIYIYKIGSYVL